MAGKKVPEPAKTPVRTVVDLNTGEMQNVRLKDGSSVTVKLLDVQESRDPLRNAIRSARVRVQVAGEELWFAAGNYHLPTFLGGARVDCTIEVSDADFEVMVTDPAQAMQLFFQGKIKVTGDPVLATKLGNLFGLGG